MNAESPLACLRGVPVTVVGGCLGAGKTTLINSWLRKEQPRDWAILVNDLGALAIDADRVRQHHGHVLELTSGCLCSRLRDGLGEALLTLARSPRPPARVVIETSGMAIPNRVADQVRLHGLRLERLLLVVDLVQRQFEGVDGLRNSKADRLDATTTRQRQQWLGAALERLPDGPGPAVEAAPRLAREDHCRQERPLSRRQLLRWDGALGPDVLRLKGDVSLQEHPEAPVHLDGSGDWLDLAEAPTGPWSSSLRRQGRLVVISRAGADPPRWPGEEDL